jgi:hypothetical protein
MPAGNCLLSPARDGMFAKQIRKTRKFIGVDLAGSMASSCPTVANHGPDSTVNVDRQSPMHGEVDGISSIQIN